jgi:hypothetical protein
VDVFHGITDFGEWEELYEIESLTNERLRVSAGNLAAVPRAWRAYGPGSAYIMAPFAYHAPGRFGDGSYGVLYAALDEPTAAAEAAYHRARFLRATGTPKELAAFQVLTLKLTGDLEDLRPLRGAELYDPDPGRYGAAQRLGAQIRAQGGDGVVYASLRRLGGECVAGFRPDRFSECRHVRMAQFYWDGAQLLPEG